MKFTKMHGIGNDYVYVDCFQEKVPHPEEVARFVSDRHFGIGSDGLILIKPSDIADCEMEMYNLDGSRGAMCGNGIRCVAKYAYDHGIVHSDHIRIATGSGIKELQLFVQNGKVSSVQVDMGSPIFSARDIPVDTALLDGIGPADTVLDTPVVICGREWRLSAVSMGNPHAVTFVEDVSSLPLFDIGPSFENHPLFPDRVNTEFVQVIDAHTVKMRVWERGSGETLACGTGACAVAVASILNKKVSSQGPITVCLLGGDLRIAWDQDKNTVFMTGPATEVFHGEIELS